MGRPVTVPDLLRERAIHHPDAVAHTTGGGEQLSMRGWEQRSRAAANGAVARGIGPGDRVALIFDGHGWVDLAVAYVAVLRAGAIAVPLSPGLPTVDLVRSLRHCAPALVVGGAGLAPEGQAWPTCALEQLETAAAEAADHRTGPDDIAEILYPDRPMRGPAGRPFSHGDIVTVRLASAGVAGAFVHAFRPGTLAAQEVLRLPLLDDGVTAVAAPAFDPGSFQLLVSANRAEVCGLTPAMARALLASPGDNGALRRLRHLVLSRPPSSSALADALAQVLPGVATTHVTGEPPVAPPVDAEVAPLVAAQDGMVWHEQFTPGSFNLAPPVRRYHGPLDVAALESALNEILRRHAALRTTFSVHGGRGVQVFPPHRRRPLRVVDLSRFPPGEQAARLAALVADARRRPFDLIVGPLFDPTLVRLGMDDHVMVIRTHHAVYDDWSVGLFRRELSALYSAFAAREPSPLRALPVDLPDVARRQDGDLRGVAGADERSFWREELDGAPLSVQLPIDDPDRPAGSPHTAPPPLSLELSAPVTEAVRSLARQQRATPFAVLLAAFAVLVQRYTGQDDLLVSTLAANRPTTDVENLIGCFGKKVLVRLRLSDDPPFRDLVTRTRRAVMGALAHQATAYEAVVQEMLGPEAAVHGLVPQVALKFQAAITATEKLSLTGLTTSGVDLPPPAEPPAHFLGGDDHPGDARQWGGGLYLGAFLGISVVESDQGLRLVTEGVFHPPEVERLLRHFHVLVADIVADPDRQISQLHTVDPADHVSPPAAATGGAAQLPSVYARFVAEARRSPDRIAVVAGDERVTFAGLDERARRVASELDDADGAPLRLSGGDGPTVELVARALGGWRGQRAIDGSTAGTDSLTTPGAAPAYVVDGTATGHAALLVAGAGIQSVIFPSDGPRRVCVPAVPESGAFVRGLLALAAGHSLHLTARSPGSDPESHVSLVARGVVDVVECRAADLRSLLAAGLRTALHERGDSRAPRPVLVVTTDEAIPPETWAEWRAIEGADVHLLYGPAQCGFGATAGPVSGGGARPSIGHPLPGMSAEVVDDLGRGVPRRALGTLVLRGPGLGHADGDGVFESGRLARVLPDGRIELVGGAGDVDLGGFRVQPARIEAALTDCPGVGEVAVVAVGNEESPGRPRLVAHIRPHDASAPPTLTTLRRWLWKQLPGYAWPAALAGAVDEAASHEAPPADAAFLASAWAEAAGRDRLSTRVNYWQSFALIDALAELAAAGDRVATRQVTRNRTIEALSIDRAATSGQSDATDYY